MKNFSWTFFYPDLKKKVFFFTLFPIVSFSKDYLNWLNITFGILCFGIDIEIPLKIKEIK